MKPTEHEFVGLPAFLAVVQSNPGIGWIYRGQSDISWPLLPKAGRPEFYLKATDAWAKRGHSSSDLGRFGQWRDHAIAFCDHLPENDFECLAYAQHYGLATRLLDWTSNPLVALFFASETQNETDGGVFCYYNETVIIPKEATFDSIKRVATYEPRPFDRRLLAQGAEFTYHPNPKEPLEAKPLEAKPIVGEASDFTPERLDLVAIRVNAMMKPILQRQLREIGISRKTLFPDLEGLSAFVNWETRRWASYKKSQAAKSAKS